MGKTSTMNGFDALRALGATKAVALFSGGHDEGSFDSNITLIGADGKKIGEAGFYAAHDGDGFESEEQKALSLHFQNVLDGCFGGFGGEPSVAGEVILDASNDSIQMTGTEERPAAFKYVWENGSGVADEPALSDAERKQIEKRYA